MIAVELYRPDELSLYHTQHNLSRAFSGHSDHSFHHNSGDSVNIVERSLSKPRKSFAALRQALGGFQQSVVPRKESEDTSISKRADLRVSTALVITRKHKSQVKRLLDDPP